MFRILIWYIITTGLLAIVLYFPVKKFILSGRRHREGKKSVGPPDDDTAGALEKSAAKTAAIISILFSILFNLFLMGRLFNKHDQ